MRRNMQLLVILAIMVTMEMATAESLYPAMPTLERTTVLSHGPDWWKIPGDPNDGRTRTQFHSFLQNPNQLASPDYTYDGYPPSVADQWTTPAIDPNAYNQPIPNSSPYPFIDPDGAPYGDGFGAYIGQAGTLSKLMGNRFVPTWTKEIFLAIIWKGAGTLTLGVTPSSGTASVSQTNQDEANDWHVSWLEGTIYPQPNSETFALTFSQAGAWVDSVWVGTHCIPEPSAVLLVAVGALLGLRRR